MVNEYIEGFVDSLQLVPGQKVYISSNMIKFMVWARERNELFDPNVLLEIVTERITTSGTLVIPTFCYEFNKKGFYDRRYSKCNTGVLGNTAIRNNMFKRTQHPIHSFAVWGADSEYLLSLSNSNPFGKDSIFEWMRGENVEQIMIDTDYTCALTFCHYCEMNAEVPYRFLKKFTGKYVDFDGKEEIRSYMYPCRIYEYGDSEQMNRIGVILEEKGLSVVQKYDEIVVNRVLLGNAYETIYHDAKYNMCRNLYDFKVDREKIWAGKVFE